MPSSALVAAQFCLAAALLATCRLPADFAPLLLALLSWHAPVRVRRLRHQRFHFRHEVGLKRRLRRVLKVKVVRRALGLLALKPLTS